MISSLSFTSIAAVTYTFMPNAKQRNQRLAPAASLSNVARPRMQMHGRWPTPTYAEALLMMQGGMIVGQGTTFAEKEADATQERASMLEAILGDLAAPPLGDYLGTLTLKMAHWDEVGLAQVGLDDYEAALDAQNAAMIPYSFDWVLFTPYFIGGDSGDPLYA